MDRMTIGSIAQLTVTAPPALPLGGQAALDAARAPFVELAQLREEVKALRKDAERYRWMRKNAITLDDFAYYIDDEVEAFVDEQIASAPRVGAA